MKPINRLVLTFIAATPAVAGAAETTSSTPYSLIQMAQGGANGIKTNAAGYADSAASGFLKNWFSAEQGTLQKINGCD